DLAVSNFDTNTVSVLLGTGAGGGGTVATPVLSPAGGTFTGPVTVTLTDSTPGATIHYTTDGSTPTGSSTVYTGPITVNQTTTIRAMATASGMTNSAVASATYTIQQQVATPTPSSTQYTGPITVTQTTTLRAMATASGMTNSAVASATYTIQQPQQVATPTFSPAAGTYVSAVTVTLSDSTAGAAIFYTLDGS